MPKQAQAKKASIPEAIRIEFENICEKHKVSGVLSYVRMTQHATDKDKQVAKMGSASALVAQDDVAEVMTAFVLGVATHTMALELLAELAIDDAFFDTA